MNLQVAPGRRYRVCRLPPAGLTRRVPAPNDLPNIMLGYSYPYPKYPTSGSFGSLGCENAFVGSGLFEELEDSGLRCLGFRVLGFRVYGFRVSGLGF